MQTKKNSFYEACINTLIGFGVTLVFSPFIYSLCGIKTSPFQLGLATVYFTALSVARSYVIRRVFNKKHVKVQEPRAKNQDAKTKTQYFCGNPSQKIFCENPNMTPATELCCCDFLHQRKVEIPIEANSDNRCEAHDYVRIDGSFICQFCGDLSDKPIY